MPTPQTPPILIPARSAAEIASIGRASAVGAQAEFAAVLGRHRVGPRAASQDAHHQAREAAEEFVAIALVQPVLEESREGSMAAEPFAPSSAERQFRALQDAALAQRITRAAHFPLVERLAKNLLRVPGGGPT